MLAPQLQGWADAYREAQTRAHAIADGLTHEQLNWKPAPSTWSVAECLVHLNKIAKGYLPVLEEAVAADSPKGNAPFQHGFVGRMFTKSVSPQSSFKMKTAGGMKPEAATAHSDYDKDRLLASFDAYTDRFVAAIESGEGLDLGRIKVASPFLALLRLPVATFLDALGQHALRHTNQAERVAEHPSFPA